MSQIIYTFDKNKKHKRVTISNVFSSTPNKSFPIKLGSISLSEIDTGSSSSGGKITRNLGSLIRGEEKIIIHILIIILLQLFIL